jgi:hypothetical protein
MSAGAAAAAAAAIAGHQGLGRGLAFHTRSREPLHLPGDAEVIEARTM